jgi:hypothetical protein
MSQTVKARVSLNLPASLKSAAERFADRDGVSLNQFIAVAIAEKVGAQNAAEFFERRGSRGDAERAIDFLGGAADTEPHGDDRV